MDLQVRKIHFVQEFLRLNNDVIVGKLENLLKHEKSKLYAENPEPYTLAQLNEIIDCAEEDAKNNRMKSVDELQKEIKTWL